MFFYSADMSADNPVKLFEQLFQMLIDKLCKYRNVVKDICKKIILHPEKILLHISLCFPKLRFFP